MGNPTLAIPVDLAVALAGVGQRHLLQRGQRRELLDAAEVQAAEVPHLRLVDAGGQSLSRRNVLSSGVSSSPDSASSPSQAASARAKPRSSWGRSRQSSSASALASVTFARKSSNSFSSD